VDPSFEYQFPAIRGIQAGREYYVSQCPVRLIPRLFTFDDSELPVEIRAQRTLNRSRLPEISQYILDNRSDYVFSAITASIDAEVKFDPISGDQEGSRIGVLHVPMSARFVINDGQHRRGALELALAEDPSLGDDTIAVVFFLDVGLERSQQMFADLNRYAVKPSASIGVLYDHRDPLSSITRGVVGRIDLLRDLVELEKTTLPAKSRKLFTLSALFTANRALLAGTDHSPEQIDVVEAFWRGVAPSFPEWEAVHARRLSAGEVRQDFIHSHGTVLHALGVVGNSLQQRPPVDWPAVSQALGKIDWSRSNTRLWEGRAMIAGRVSKASQNVTLTANAIKQAIGIPLSPEEQRIEDAFVGMDGSAHD
jgi:DNA sulfur modification protein DndB